jgi:hypothetical protein
MKMDFVPYIERLFPAMLMGINGEKEMLAMPWRFQMYTYICGESPNCLVYNGTSY